MDDSKERCIERYITVTSGLRGSFAVLVGVFECNGRTYSDVIQTSPFSGTSEQARQDAKDWAKAEELEVI